MKTDDRQRGQREQALMRLGALAREITYLQTNLQLHGQPIYLSRQELEELRRSLSGVADFVRSCQIALMEQEGSHD